MPRPGLYLVEKPVGPTSFGVLRSLRPALGSKLGHAGTLDPFAGGLLLVLAEAATRLAPYLSGVDKTYRAVVQFGEVSTTLDPEGTITVTGGSTDRASVEGAAAGMTGDVLQRVPAASAVKIAGERVLRPDAAWGGRRAGAADGAHRADRRHRVRRPHPEGGDRRRVLEGHLRPPDRRATWASRPAPGRCASACAG